MFADVFQSTPQINISSLFKDDKSREYHKKICSELFPCHHKHASFSWWNNSVEGVKKKSCSWCFYERHRTKVKIASLWMENSTEDFYRRIQNKLLSCLNFFLFLHLCNFSFRLLSAQQKKMFVFPNNFLFLVLRVN